MGKYLDIVDRAEARQAYEKNERNEKTYTDARTISPDHNLKGDLFRFFRLFRTRSELERRCPDHIPLSDWHQAVEDGRRFLAQWGEQAEALGWTPRDLFGLDEVPAKPHPSYRRLSRYDHTGLIWMLQGCPVVALTEATAAIRSPTGSITTYRRFHKPAFGRWATRSRIF
jgi:hypothetical protein